MYSIDNKIILKQILICYTEKKILDEFIFYSTVQNIIIFRNATFESVVTTCFNIWRSFFRQFNPMKKAKL